MKVVVFEHISTQLCIRTTRNLILVGLARENNAVITMKKNKICMLNYGKISLEQCLGGRKL